MNKAKDVRKASISGGRFGVLKGALFALLIALAVGGILVLLAAIALFLAPRGAAYISLVGTLIGLLTALIGGLIAGKLNRHAGALAGLLFGIFFLAVLLLLGRFFYTGAPLIKRLLGCILFLALSLVGGALGGTRLSRGRHKRRRR